MFEDTEANRRASVVRFISITSIVASLLTPMAGGLISLYSVEMGCRYIFLTSVVSNAIMFITRQAFLRESKIGELLSSDINVS